MARRVGKSILSVVQLLSSNVLVKFLGLAMISFYARYLTKEGLSVIPLHHMVASLPLVACGFGLGPTLLRLLPSRAVSEPEEARGLIFSSTALLLAGVTFFAALLFVFAAPISVWLFRNEESVVLTRIFAVGSLMTAMREVLRNVLWAVSRFDKISLVQVVGALSRAAMGATFTLLWGVKGLAVALVAADAVGLLLSAWFLADWFRIAPRRWYPWTDLIRQSLPFYFEGFLVYFRGKGDNWIIAGAMGPEAIATYFVAKRLPQMLMMMRGSIDNVMATRISKMVANVDEIAAYLPRLYDLVSHTVQPVIFAFLGMTPTIIYVIGGPEYSGAVLPGIILCLVQLTQFLIAPGSRALFVVRDPIYRVLSTAGESVFILGGLVLLVRPFQEIGVAGSLLLAGIASFGLVRVLLRPALSFRFPSGQFLASLTASTAMAALMLAGQVWNPALILTPVYALSGLLVFFILVSVLNSRRFYGTLNSVSPFRLVDPIRWILRRPAA